MTIGIAAHAALGREPRIVLCTDWLVGDGISSVEHSDKIDIEFPGSLVCLWAGTLEDVNDFLRVYRGRITYKTKRDDLKAILHSGMKGVVKALGKRGRKSTDADLLIAGFIENQEPVILNLNQNGVCEIQTWYSIGSGAEFASPLMRWRYQDQLDPWTNVREVLYRVYESKRFSETCDSVGKRTTLMVLSPVPDGVHFQHISSGELERLDAAFHQYGPQRLPKERDKFPDVPNVI